MIKSLNNAKPFIDFGFGTIEKQAAESEVVTVWLNTIYNLKAYDFTLTAPSGTITAISAYEHQVTYASAGNYQISLSAGTKDKSISLESNILTLTVV